MLDGEKCGGGGCVPLVMLLQVSRGVLFVCWDLIMSRVREKRTKESVLRVKAAGQ